MTTPNSSDAVEAISTKTVARLHDVTTLFHSFVYFAPETRDELAALGIEGPAGYFGSRAAAMGPVPTEMVVATFYNFSPDLVAQAIDGLWKTTTPAEFQSARWRAVKKVLDQHVRPVMTASEITEATSLAQTASDNLEWAGRPLAAGNAAQLAVLAKEEFGSDELLWLWQLATILREWRGDTHIGLLIAEPLDACECTVVSELMAGLKPGAIRITRAWGDDEWQAAIDRLTQRGWLDRDGSINAEGKAGRTRLEERTNELSRAIWAGVGEDQAHRLGDLLKPGTEALIASGYFAHLGLPRRR